jgi:peptide/nickel transport system permease protein
VKRADEAVEWILGAFLAVEGATADWLVAPVTGRRHRVDKLYPELGLVVSFHRNGAMAADEKASPQEELAELCRRAGIALVVVNAAGRIGSQTLDEICAALSVAARRVAQQRGAGQAKLETLPRISAARAKCQDLRLAAQQTEALPRAASPSQTAMAAQSRLAPGRLRRRLRANSRRWRSDWEVFSQNRLAVFGLVVVGIFFLMAIAHPILRATVWQHNRYDPVTGYDMTVIHPSAPSRIHLLGTDTLGRDVLSMLLAATTPTFIVGISAALTTAAIGTAIGVVSAYRKGTVDTIFTHVSDAFLLLPAPLFMVIVGMRYRDIGAVQLGLIYGIIAGAGAAAIVMRAQALKVVVRPFIDAARIAGGGGRRVMFVHIVPHMLPLASLYMMLAVTGAVVADAFIAFFGFTRSYLNWGTIIYLSFAYSSYLRGGVEWHVMIPPSIALSLFAAAFYFVSRGLHQVADPRLRVR